MLVPCDDGDSLFFFAGFQLPEKCPRRCERSRRRLPSLRERHCRLFGFRTRESGPLDDQPSLTSVKPWGSLGALWAKA